MTDKKSSVSRRNLLKSIAAGSGAIVAGKTLPESWSKPVVDSVMLPAHAQTSVCSGPYTATAPEFLWLDVTLATSSFTTRIGFPPPTIPENVSFGYVTNTLFFYAYDTNELNSSEASGPRPFGAFSTILTDVSGANPHTLNAIVELCGPNTINISGLSLTPLTP